MLRTMTRFALLLALGLVGCSVPTSVGELQSSVQDGDGMGSTTAAAEGSTTDEDGAMTATSSDEDASSSGSSGSTGPELIPEMGGFVIRWGDIPEDDEEDTVNTGVGTGNDWDPDAILVQIGVSVSSCDDVNPIEPCSTWQASFTLEPDQQIVGSFDGSQINATFSEIGPGNDPNSCDGYGGGSLETTVVVESIDDTGLQIRFENVVNPILDVDLEGFEVFIPRC